MQLLKAVLFDLDGTLIHSVDHIVDCWQHTVRTALGREITREEVLPTLGRPLLECFEEIAPGRGEAMREVYRAYQQTTHDSAITLVAGTRETLEHLKGAGLALGVVTSKGLQVAMEGLDLFNLAPYFDTLVTYEDTARHKPHPDPVLAASQRLGIEPAHLLYVGDAVVDIEAGKAAGMLTCAVTWGSGTLADLEAARPHYVISRMRDLVTLLSTGTQVA
jgi:pyrophosphatase PpaX